MGILFRLLKTFLTGVTRKINFLRPTVVMRERGLKILSGTILGTETNPVITIIKTVTLTTKTVIVTNIVLTTTRTGTVAKTDMITAKTAIAVTTVLTDLKIVIRGLTRMIIESRALA